MNPKLAKLMELKTRAVEATERVVGECARATEQAAKLLKTAEEQCEAALVAADEPREESAWDVGYRRAHLQTVRDVVTRRHAALRAAEAKETEARAAMVDAKREHKKLEMWCETRARELSAEDARKERLLTDDLALRGARRA